MKNGTGAGGVCQYVEAGRLTHCGTEASRSCRGHKGYGRDPSYYVQRNIYKPKAEPPLLQVDVPQQGLVLPRGRNNRNHLCSIYDPTGLIITTMEVQASVFLTPQAPLCWRWCNSSSLGTMEMLLGYVDTEESLTMLPSCDCISPSAGCK